MPTLSLTVLISRVGIPFARWWGGTERGQVGRCLAMGLCVWLAGLPLTPASLCGFPYSSIPFEGWGILTSPRGWPQLDLPLVLVLLALLPVFQGWVR